MKNIILLLLITTSTYAQLKSIKGKVIDDKTKEALPYVNLFIGNTTKGTSTNETGEFTFTNLPIGSYNVVASMVGYFTKSTPIVVKEENSVIEIVISLQQNEQILDEVSVKSSKDKVWNAQFMRFKNIFFGITENAKKCKILNPYVIDFEEKDDKLFAKSSQPILIENLALGYKLTFVMKAFEVSKTDFFIAGDTFFEELLATPKEEVTWREKRLETYQGSINHFFQALSRRTSSQDGFNVYAYLPNANAKKISRAFFDNLRIHKTVIKVNPDSLISQSGTMTYLDLTKNIEIHYTQKNEFRGPYTDINYQISKFESKKKLVRYNQYGSFENPLDVSVIGSFSNNRVAEMLPIDYQPKIEELIAKIAVSLDEKNFANLQENIVFHINKSNYYLGETVWFKTYLIYTNPTYRDAISKVIYVDLINDEQKVIESKVLKIKNGVSNGDFLLNTQFKNGRYFLRAYTNWQQNFGDSTQTVQEIAVLSKNETIDSQITDFKEDSPITLNKNSISSSENVEIAFEAIPNHSYSISVTNENAVKIYQPITHKAFSKQTISLESINFNSETERTFFGKTKDANGKPISADLMMMRKDTFLMDTFQSDKEGNFKVENVTGNDTMKIDILAIGKKGKPISKIMLEEPPKPKFYRPKIYNNFKIINNQPTSTSSSVSYDYNFDINNSIILQEVAIKAKKPDTTMLMRLQRIYGKPSFVFTDKQIDFNASPNLIQTLQGRVAGLIIKFDALTGVQSVVWSRGGAPQIWVDGVRMKDMTDVASFVSPNMIARIDVHRQNTTIIAPSGIIAIYTKSFMAGSDLSPINSPPAEGIKRFKMAGFYTPKKFYLPENELDATKLFQLKNRSTIYWNPNVFSDNYGKAKLSFQAIGNPGQYRVEIVGYDADGKIIKMETRFVIK